MTSVRENLIAAKALIDTPEKWCRGPIAHRRTGAAHCVWMAVAMAHAYPAREALTRVLPWWWRARFIFSGMRGGDAELIRFNDRPKTTHADIMALFDRAISSLNEEGKDK